MLRSNMGWLNVSIKDGIQAVTFNRPETKNAINAETYKELIGRLNSSAKDQSVALTVLTGTGNFYSSGNDFNPNNIENFKEYVEEGTDLVQKLVDAFIDYPKLLIAVVNGPAIGIACTTLALCDIVYASDKAWFCTPFSKLGLVPEGCSTLTFPRLMGSAKASKLLYLNETMTAEDALACGFVTQVFTDSQLVNETTTLIEGLTKLPSQSLLMSKQLVRQWDRDLLHRVNHEECKVLKQRFASQDFYEALLTFKKGRSKL